VDRWGPLAGALITLLATLWYGRWLEGRLDELQSRLAERTEIEVALRVETQTWQAYVVSLKEAMIRAGIGDVPPPPKPVTVDRAGGRVEITNNKRRK